MKIILGLSNLDQKIRKSVITIGKFDGVHIGHQRLIKRIVDEARMIDGTSVVITFDQSFLKLQGDFLKQKTITPLSLKAKIIAGLGVDILLVLDLNHSLANLEPETFVHNILIKQLDVAKIIVGPDFRFGKNRTGTIMLLRLLGKQNGFYVHTIPFVKIDNIRVSSTEIRTLLWKNEFETATQMLGRKRIFVT
jgi:riboflavin kinase/FMN adenylyltransferase